MDLESLKNECVSLKNELESAVQGRNAIKSDYDIYKKRVQSVLAEQDSQFNRTTDLERSLQASTATCDAKSRELQRVLARLSEMEAVAAQVPLRNAASLPCVVVFILVQETSALHSLRQQLADAVNARDVARLREQAADGRAAAAETVRAALETAASAAEATAACEIRSLRSALHSAQERCAELQSMLQHKDAEAAETLRSASAEMSTLSAALLNLQQVHRYAQAGCVGVFFISCFIHLSSATLLDLEKYKGDKAGASSALFIENSSSAEQKVSHAHASSAASSSASRTRYPQPSLESLLSTPSATTTTTTTTTTANVRLPSAPLHIPSETDVQQSQLHVAALELQISTLREALQDSQDQCSLFEKQCTWFKKKELELQLAQDRNSSASDLDYLRRRVFCCICVRYIVLTPASCSVVVSYMESHDPSVIPAIAQVKRLRRMCFSVEIV